MISCFFILFFVQMKKVFGEIGMFSVSCNNDGSYVEWNPTIPIGQWSVAGDAVTAGSAAC